MTNRLADEASTYLRQHADNPVDWRPWSAEAFAEARERRVPVLLSVGYAACHWCHVMAHESFDDPGIASVMNERFVCVKVDRQERPDVDAVYMQATVAMTGSGGWPMTCFLTPDGRPFYCGTYFPPVARGGMPGFGELLVAVSEAWSGRPDDVERTAVAVADRLRDLAAPVDGGSAPLDRATVTATIGRSLAPLLRDEDRVHGGWGGAPKFPPSTVLELLLRRASTRDADGDRAWGMAERTLLAMARSGMADQLGGGFARYSVDAGWVVPHFEKMLYDNALLLRAYTFAAARGGPHADEFARVARGCAEFLLGDLRTPDGLFAAALDADTPGEGEGATYVWTPAQLAAALGPDDGAWVAELCGVTDTGTFEHGTSTLQLLRRLDDDPSDLARWEGLRDRLLEVRRGRVQPQRDDLVVAGWNGLAIGALATAGVVFGEPEWTRQATLAADALLTVHEVEPGVLVRSSSSGVPGSARGVLEDYAGMAVGLLATFGVTGDRVLVDAARRLLDAVATRFSLEGTLGLADTDSAAPALLVRPGDVSDNATPSARYLAADAFTTLAGLTGDAVCSERATAAVGPALTLGDRVPRAVGWGLAVAWSAATGAVEVAVVGAAEDPERARLLGVAAGSPGVTLASAVPGDAAAVPLLADRVAIGGRPTAYLCRHFVCSLPTCDPDELAGQLRAVLDAASADRSTS